MTETSNQLYVRLVNMRNSAGENLFERLTLCQKLLADRDWVTDPTAGGGDEGKALDRLEADCFADVCGAMSLPEMLELIRAIPQVKTWRANKFNLRLMLAELRERSRPAKKINEPKVVTDLDPKDRKIEALNARIAELETHNRQLNHEVKELRRKLKKIEDTLSVGTAVA